MNLSELTAYAAGKYRMKEQHKWSDFPGFSVLSNPCTGKWVALLMRQWDSESGREIQRCDLKCGQQVLYEQPASFLSKPYRMKGPKWIGVAFEDTTNAEVIYHLFDQAVRSDAAQGYTVVLHNPATQGTVVYADTPLAPSDKAFPAIGENIPPKIYEMRKLYVCKDWSFPEKCENFYRQGKFMEDYEDDAPWSGEFKRYFPTYHDLNVRQLRGYFTWRTQVRKGTFSPVATSLAYIYVYELLNGIGTSSPEESLRKMKEFETGFLDAGQGDAGMRKNLHRWMLEFAVLHGLPPKEARRYTDPALLEQDLSLGILQNPEEASDEQVFSAVCVFAGPKLAESPVVKKGGAQGIHLFASVWRHARKTCTSDGKDGFTACFGEPKARPWNPLSNAVYWKKTPSEDIEYQLDACRSYHCRDGEWWEEKYATLYLGKERFCALFHETDRRLRKHMKTGHYLREKPEEAWAGPLVEAVLEAERAAAWEAAKPKITIDPAQLEKIRMDALVTRDSLLTEEELAEVSDEENALLSKEEPQPEPEKISPNVSAADSVLPGLDGSYLHLLHVLLQGGSPEPILQAHKWMPSVVADAINEAFFEEIGDSVLACDGETIHVVEEYREDILGLLGGISG